MPVVSRNCMAGWIGLSWTCPWNLAFHNPLSHTSIISLISKVRKMHHPATAKSFMFC